MKAKSVPERISSLVMAGVLAMSMSVPATAFADNEPSSGLQSGTGKTQLFTMSKNSEFGGTAEKQYLDKDGNPTDAATDSDTGVANAKNPYYNPADENDAEGLGKNLKFTVPSALTFIIDDDGSLIAPTTAKVENKSDSAIHVSALKVDENDDWNIVADATDAAAVADTDNAISLSIAPVTDATTTPVTTGKAAGLSGFVGAKKSLARPDQWNMTAADGASDTKTLSFAGNVANVEANTNTQQGFGEICWYMTTGEGTVEPNLNLGDGVTVDGTAKVSLAHGFYNISADSLSLAGGGANIEDGDTVTLTYGSEEEYHPDQITITNASTGEVLDTVEVNRLNGTVTFTMPEGGISIAINFAEGKYDEDYIKSKVGWNNESSWDDIAYALQCHYNSTFDLTSESDMGDKAWKVNDTKTVHLNSFSCVGADDDGSIWDTPTEGATKLPVKEKDVTFRIVDIKNHSAYKMTDNANVSPTFVVMQDEISCLAQMNTTDTNAGGWASSRLRSHLQEGGSYYEALEDGFTNLLKQVKVPTTAGNKSTTIKYSDDFLFLPSEYEMFGKKTSAAANEGSGNWEYFKTAGNRKKAYSVTSRAYNWWERSPGSGISGYFCRVDSDGTAYYNSASNGYGLAPSGCI